MIVNFQRVGVTCFQLWATSGAVTAWPFALMIFVTGENKPNAKYERGGTGLFTQKSRLGVTEPTPTRIVGAAFVWAGLTAGTPTANSAIASTAPNTWFLRILKLLSTPTRGTT